MSKKSDTIVYQAKNGAIELKGDFEKDTLWANLQQIADLFETNKSGISRHINNIYKTDELKRNTTVAKIATVQKEGERNVKREIEFFNLDMILSVGYRVNSKKATVFRKWATKTLRSHITEGYTINPSRIEKNYETFMKAVEDIKKLASKNALLKTDDVLELVKTFAGTWFSLESYDKSSFPRSAVSKKQVEFTGEELAGAIAGLKKELISKKEATDLFANERAKDGISGIVGNIFQSFGGNDLYPTIEEKAAHLLYFIIKNHPFTDGNKRSGAFAFVWFLRKAGILDVTRMTPEALTTLTLLVAESNPKEKERMIGLILFLLKK
jgi:prophage maintenance system killer protein/prophage antirepressor-like protein